MSADLTPYLNFGGTAREAMEYYASIFGGTPEVMTFGQGGMEGVDPDLVMHSSLAADNGFRIFGADYPPEMGPAPVAGNITMSLSGEDEDTLNGYWNALAEGGTVRTPLAPAPWGASYGDLVDRYGIAWLVNIGGAAVEG